LDGEEASEVFGFDRPQKGCGCEIGVENVLGAGTLAFIRAASIAPPMVWVGASGPRIRSAQLSAIRCFLTSSE
jgi:hypothetical protein